MDSDGRGEILPALLVGSGLKQVTTPRTPIRLISPGFIGREWIETCVMWGGAADLYVLPALLVGSGLKQHPFAML